MLLRPVVLGASLADGSGDQGEPESPDLPGARTMTAPGMSAEGSPGAVSVRERNPSASAGTTPATTGPPGAPLEAADENGSTGTAICRPSLVPSQPPQALMVSVSRLTVLDFEG